MGSAAPGSLEGETPEDPLGTVYQVSVALLARHEFDKPASSETAQPPLPPPDLIRELQPSPQEPPREEGKERDCGR